MDINKADSKSIIRSNKRGWEKMKIRDMHADTRLIKCQKKLFPKGRGRKLLDLGFGEGQNLIYFLSQGFRCWGTEIAESRVKFLSKKLKCNNQRATLELVGSNILPFKDNYFDIVVAWESLYYNNKAGFQETVDEILRTLKPGGRLLASVLSSRHNVCIYGKEIAPSTFRPIHTSNQATCVVYTPKNKTVIKKMFSKFENLAIGFYSSLLFGPSDYDYHYIIYCEKPKIR